MYKGYWTPETSTWREAISTGRGFTEGRTFRVGLRSRGKVTKTVFVGVLQHWRVVKHRAKLVNGETDHDDGD